MDEKEEESDEDMPTLENPDGSVSAENVFFSYDKNVPLIEDFNLKVNPGMRVAIVGPTGCGKTEIWRCLHTLFPHRIVIVDVSSLTMEGFAGNTKWQDLFRSEHFRDSKNTIMVLDETDKIISPKFTSMGENVSEHIMNEGLKIIEGTNMKIKMSNDNYRYVDTNTVSFVLLGAFSRKAE